MESIVILASTERWPCASAAQGFSEHWGIIGEDFANASGLQLKYSAYFKALALMITLRGR